MVIADVGQDAREEIDVAPSPAAGVVGGAGANYGWNCREGFIAYSNPAAACATASGFTEPVFDYPHEDPGGGAPFGCSIIGGYVVRDPSLGDLYGRYLYTDFCSEEIRSLVLPRGGGIASGDRSEGLAVEKPTSFGEDSCGRIYVASQERAALPPGRTGPGRLLRSGHARNSHDADELFARWRRTPVEVGARPPAALGQAAASRRLALQDQGPARPVPGRRRSAGAAEPQRQELRQQTTRSPLPGAVLADRRQTDADPRLRPPRR